MTIKVIETSYKGYRFRSRTEARWAVFLDHAGVKFDYEPQGYVLDGKPYLPDFLLNPGTPQQTWLEIKGQFPDPDEIAKAEALARETGIRTYLYFGPCEQPGPGLSSITTWDEYFREWGPQPRWSDEHGWLYNGSDALAFEAPLLPTAFRFDPGLDRKPKSNFWWWADCTICGRVILKLHGLTGWCPTVPDPEDGTVPAVLGTGPGFAHETDRLRRAYKAARSARFEHGESPDVPDEQPMAHAVQKVIDGIERSTKSAE
jgi:hypothetical protein